MEKKNKNSERRRKVHVVVKQSIFGEASVFHWNNENRVKGNAHVRALGIAVYVSHRGKNEKITGSPDSVKVSGVNPSPRESELNPHGSAGKAVQTKLWVFSLFLIKQFQRIIKPDLDDFHEASLSNFLIEFADNISSSFWFQFLVKRNY